jgi:hypothetical protein
MIPIYQYKLPTIAHQRVVQIAEDAQSENDSDNDTMYDILDMHNTFTEDEEDEYDTFGHTKPGDDHDHTLVQADLGKT